MKTHILIIFIITLVFVCIVFLVKKFTENKIKVWNLDPPQDIEKYAPQELKMYILHYFKTYPIPPEILLEEKKTLKYIKERIDPLAENLSSKLQRNSWHTVNPRKILEGLKEL